MYPYAAVGSSVTYLGGQSKERANITELLCRHRSRARREVVIGVVRCLGAWCMHVNKAYQSKPKISLVVRKVNVTNRQAERKGQNETTNAGEGDFEKDGGGRLLGMC